MAAEADLRIKTFFHTKGGAVETPLCNIRPFHLPHHVTPLISSLCQQKPAIYRKGKTNDVFSRIDYTIPT